MFEKKDAENVRSKFYFVFKLRKYDFFFFLKMQNIETSRRGKRLRMKKHIILLPWYAVDERLRGHARTPLAEMHAWKGQTFYKPSVSIKNNCKIACFVDYVLC